MRQGRRLAIDVGKTRIGIAVCDFHGILASGLATVLRKADLDETILLVFKAVTDHGLELSDIIEGYVGLPMNLKGNDTESTRDAIAVAIQLANSVAFEVRLIDERLTTVSAAAALRSSGINSKKGRGVIDQVAATFILEQALAVERASGNQPGIRLSDYEGQTF